MRFASFPFASLVAFRPPAGLAALLLVALMAAAPVRAMETKARQAILLDYDTGTVLFEKNADERMHPSSMSKLMTVYMVFERLKDGSLSLDDEFLVSEKAWRKGGSKMFVEVGKKVRVEDLLRGILIQSGNDACIVVAENLATSEEAFAKEMTRRARELGLGDSNFVNATGWPDDGHYMSARDLAILAQHLITDFPEYYGLFGETEFTFSGIRQQNRNPLLYRPGLDADGLKTGHTEAGGYGLVASAKHKGRRLILVVNGLASMNERATEPERLLNWGFREFQNLDMFVAGEVVSEAEVWLGAKSAVPLVTDRPIKLTVPRREMSDMTVKVIYTGPIPAPIRQGDHIADLVIDIDGLEPIRYPLSAAETVDKLGFVGRLGAALQHILWGHSG